jgi:hypothetical protein
MEGEDGRREADEETGPPRAAAPFAESGDAVHEDQQEERSVEHLESPEQRLRREPAGGEGEATVQVPEPGDGAELLQPADRLELIGGGVEVRGGDGGVGEAQQGARGERRGAEAASGRQPAP